MVAASHNMPQESTRHLPCYAEKDIIILHQQWGLFPCNLQLMFYDVLRVYAFLSFLKSSSSVLYKTGQRRKCSLHWEEAMAELNPLESQV